MSQMNNEELLKSYELRSIQTKLNIWLWQYAVTNVYQLLNMINFGVGRDPLTFDLWLVRTTPNDSTPTEIYLLVSDDQGDPGCE